MENIILLPFVLLPFGLLLYWFLFDKSFIEDTKPKTPPKKTKDKTYITNRGETVKSYGELKIANYLDSRGIVYEYEHEFIRKDGGINKPDFYLPKYNIYIEYYGMCNLSKQYNFHMHLKFNTFQDENLKVINLYRKHISNNTLKLGLEIQFKNLTGQYLPNRNHYSIG